MADFEQNNNAPETIGNLTGAEGAVNNVQANGGTDALQCKLGEKFHPRFGCIPDSARGNGDLKGGGSLPQQGQAPSRPQNGPQNTLNNPVATAAMNNFLAQKGAPSFNANNFSQWSQQNPELARQAMAAAMAKAPVQPTRDPRGNLAMNTTNQRGGD